MTWAAEEETAFLKTAAIDPTLLQGSRTRTYVTAPPTKRLSKFLLSTRAPLVSSLLRSLFFHLDNPFQIYGFRSVDTW